METLETLGVMVVIMVNHSPLMIMAMTKVVTTAPVFTKVG